MILALIVLALSALFATASIKKGPYLIYPGNNTQMTVLWQIDSSSNCALAWGSDTSYLAGNATTHETNSSHQHKQLIANLSPGKKYYYRLTAGGSTYSGTFLAAPIVAATSLKFMAFGDTRTNVGDLNAICGAMKAVYAADPAYQTFALHTGDWVSDDTETAWTNEFFTRGSSGSNIMDILTRMPLQGCIGNHEGAGVYYKKYWPYPYINSTSDDWSFDYGPAHIAIIDQFSTSGGPSDAQVNWLKNDLEQTRKAWKFLVFHEPAWTASNPNHQNNLRAEQVLQPLCIKYGIDICFSGHVHCYARCAVNNVQHLTLGGGGAPLYKVDTTQPAYVVKAVSINHFAKLEINKNILHCEVDQASGKAIDSFTLTHSSRNNVQTWRTYD